MTSTVMTLVENHPYMAAGVPFIVIGVVSMLTVLKRPFTNPVPSEKIEPEVPWKDPHEEQ